MTWSVPKSKKWTEPVSVDRDRDGPTLGPGEGQNTTVVARGETLVLRYLGLFVLFKSGLIRRGIAQPEVVAAAAACSTEARGKHPASLPASCYTGSTDF